MARVNYQFQKHQKEVARQKKREEKIRRKQEKKALEAAAVPEPVQPAPPVETV